MAGNTTSTGAMLIRAEVWSNQLKDVLQDELLAMNHVDWISFPDGDTLTIPSMGDLDVADYAEDTAVQYTALATGEFQFTITEYLSSATYITMKQRQDSMYAARLEASFVPKQSRAIAVRMEGDILDQGQPGTPNGQTASNSNNINGAAHRWVGSDTANSNRTLGFKDFAKALYSLKKANVPQSNLIAIVDPSVEYHFNTLSQTLDVTYNPMWEGIVKSGIATGMRFSRNIYGFDVYVSQHLPVIASSETIDSVASGANAVANLFFSADASVKPIVGAVRQSPKVDAEFNKDFQREEYVTTCRYGLKLYRPENFISVLSSTNVIV
jgi:HK97 family phage major capsid protein